MTAPSAVVTDLSGKVAWVTGAGRGLGRAIAEGLAAAGATVAVTSRTEVELKDFAQSTDARVLVAAGSVADPEFVAGTADRIVAEFGALDVLVTAAGISPVVTRSEALSDRAWDEIISVNLSGTLYCCREAGRHMLAAGSGSIVTISSVHGRTGIPCQVAYAASKGGVEQITRTLGIEWARRGVRVNCLAPGYFRTTLTDAYLDSRHGERVMSRIPMSRAGEVPEIVGAAIFLAGDSASYVTGSVLSVDGGWTAA